MLPVSSSAHLALLPGLLGWPEPPHRTTFAAALHAGSTLGICWGLRRDLLALARTRAGRRTALLAAATSVPAAVAGLLGSEAVEARLGRPRQVAVLLAGAGVLMAAADRRPAQAGIGTRQAAVAALAQVAALAPGVSRSGAALTALRAAGVRRDEAARFALLMSLPVTAGAAGLSLVRAEPQVLRALASPLAVGVPAAALAAGLAVRRRPPRSLAGPALYRLALATVVVVREQGRGRG